MLTAEQLLQLTLGQQIFQIAVLTAERDQLRAEVERLKAQAPETK